MQDESVLVFIREKPHRNLRCYHPPASYARPASDPLNLLRLQDFADPICCIFIIQMPGNLLPKLGHLQPIRMSSLRFS